MNKSCEISEVFNAKRMQKSVLKCPLSVAQILAFFNEEKCIVNL